MADQRYDAEKQAWLRSVLGVAPTDNSFVSQNVAVQRRDSVEGGYWKHLAQTMALDTVQNQQNQQGRSQVPATHTQRIERPTVSPLTPMFPSHNQGHNGSPTTNFPNQNAMALAGQYQSPQTPVRRSLGYIPHTAVPNSGTHPQPPIQGLQPRQPVNVSTLPSNASPPDHYVRGPPASNGVPNPNLIYNFHQQFPGGFKRIPQNGTSPMDQPKTNTPSTANPAPPPRRPSLAGNSHQTAQVPFQQVLPPIQLPQVAPRQPQFRPSTPVPAPASRNPTASLFHNLDGYSLTPKDRERMQRQIAIQKPPPPLTHPAAASLMHELMQQRRSEVASSRLSLEAAKHGASSLNLQSSKGGVNTPDPSDAPGASRGEMQSIWQQAQMSRGRNDSCVGLGDATPTATTVATTTNEPASLLSRINKPAAVAATNEPASLLSRINKPVGAQTRDKNTGLADARVTSKGRHDGLRARAEQNGVRMSDVEYGTRTKKLTEASSISFSRQWLPLPESIYPTSLIPTTETSVAARTFNGTAVFSEQGFDADMDVEYNATTVPALGFTLEMCSAEPYGVFRAPEYPLVSEQAADVLFALQSNEQVEKSEWEEGEDGQWMVTKNDDMEVEHGLELHRWAASAFSEGE